MKIKVLENTPIDPREFDLPEQFDEGNIEDIVEIFNTPLIGHYNWDYTDADSRIKKLYELGKKLNWDGSIDLDWSKGIKKGEAPVKAELLARMEGPLAALPEEDRLEYMWHDSAWSLSQFLHGEQGALLVASQLVSCAPTYQAKLYAASQTFDEARHVEVFARYLREVSGVEYPINKNLKSLLDKILADPRWDLKFIGMQIIIEGLALAAFQTTKETSKNHKELLRRLHVKEGKKILEGAEAFLLVWKKIPKYKFLYNFFKLPIIFNIFSFIYEILAFFLYLKNKKQLKD